MGPLCRGGCWVRRTRAHLHTHKRTRLNLPSPPLPRGSFHSEAAALSANEWAHINSRTNKEKVNGSGRDGWWWWWWWCAEGVSGASAERRESERWKQGALAKVSRLSSDKVSLSDGWLSLFESEKPLELRNVWVLFITPPHPSKHHHHHHLSYTT